MDPDDFNSLSVMMDNLRDAIIALSTELDLRLSPMADELRTANLLALLPHLDEQDRAATLAAARRRLENA